MDKNQYAAFLACAVMPAVVQIVLQHSTDNTTEAIRKLYHSKLYALLEDESTKLWHYSPLTLFAMYQSEQETGSIAFPEEAA